MNVMTGQRPDVPCQAISAALCLLLCLGALTGCGNKEDAAPGEGVTDRQAADGPGSGYMDMKGWEQAKAEMKTNEGIVKAFNEFFGIWSRAYEHRTFLRFREALGEAERLPGAMDEVERLVNAMKSVPGYPEISELKECHVKMIPLLRTGAEHLKKSIVAARDGDGAAEKRHEGAYVIKYKEAMAFNRKSFAIMGEIYTRGGRTEYQKLAGVQKHDASTAASFRAAVARVLADYDGPIMKDIAALSASADRGRWDRAAKIADEVYPRIQRSIMEAGRAEPGDLKGLWDARQELVAMLSYRLMGVTKLKEYINYAKSGNQEEAEKSKKVYRITADSAEQSRLKLKRMGY